MNARRRLHIGLLRVIADHGYDLTNDYRLGPMIFLTSGGHHVASCGIATNTALSSCAVRLQSHQLFHYCTEYRTRGKLCVLTEQEKTPLREYIDIA